MTQRRATASVAGSAPDPMPAGRAAIDAWRDLRNRLVSSSRFRRLASSLPFTRPIAERNLRRVFDLCAGFTYSQVLLACVDVELPRLLAAGPLGVEDLAVETGLPVPALLRLLTAASALDLVEKRKDGRYGLGVVGTIVASEPGLVELISHHRLLYADLTDPVALLRGGTTQTLTSGYWTYARRPAALAEDRDIAGYTDLMSASQEAIAESILDAYDFSRHRRLLDVAGGDGSFAIAAMRRVPHLCSTTFDLPAVARRAESRIASAGLTARGRSAGGDFLNDPLPRGCDVVTLVRVALDHDDETAERLLRSIRAALHPGGRLVIAEPIAGTPGSERITDAYFGLYLLAMGGGRTRTVEDFRSLLHRTGFDGVRLLPTRQRLLCGLVVARAAHDAM